MNIEARIKHLNAIKAQCDKEIAELTKPKDIIAEDNYFDNTIAVEAEVETAAMFDAVEKVKPKRKHNGSR